MMCIPLTNQVNLQISAYELLSDSPFRNLYREKLTYETKHHFFLLKTGYGTDMEEYT